MIVEIPQSLWQFAAFYASAFLVSFIILIWEGRKRKLPQLQWLIVIASGFIFFVFGCRIMTYSNADWSAILSNQPIGHATGLMMMGGLLFSVPAILAAKRLVNLNESVLDAYSYVLPVGMCLQRIGCFLNGCCFGTVTSKFGIQYGQGTSAFMDHYNEGLIPESSLHSLPVHPVQLYEALGCIIAVIFIWRYRGTFKSAGSLFYLSGLTYYVVRFITEFFRDSNAYAVDVPVWMGLNAIQWLLLPLIVGSLIIIAARERKPIITLEQKRSAITIKYIVYFLTLSFLFFFASKWLRPTEILVVYLVLFTTGGYLLVELFKTITVPHLRVASLSLMLLSLVMMSQTYPDLSASDSTRISYNTISIGGLAGNQTLTMITQDCNGATTGEIEYKNKYKLMGLGFSRTVQTGRLKSFTVGISGFTGTHDEEISGDLIASRPQLTTYAITPYGQFDYPRIGFGLGLHVGDMSFINDTPDLSSVQRYSVYPQLYVRFGRINKFFGELSLARGFPSTFPGNVYQMNLGFAINKDKLNSGVIRIGTSTATGMFLASSIPIGKHFVMEPYAGFLGSAFMKVAGYETNAGLIGSLSLHYKFGMRPVEKSIQEKQ